MNESLKVRLVGAAVLLIAAGLLWPLLFDFDESLQPEPLQLDLPDAKQVADEVRHSKSFAKHSVDALKTADTDSALSRAEVDTGKDSPTEAQRKEEQPIKPVEAKSSSHSAIVQRLGEDQVPQLNEQGIPVAYVVQVGTFGRWDNADNFRNTLIERKLKAYVRPETSRQPGPYRVLIGPELTYSSAKEVSELLRREHNITDTFIRKFGQR